MAFTDVIAGRPLGAEGVASNSPPGGSTGGNTGGNTGGGSRGDKKDYTNLLLSDPGYPVPMPPARTMQEPRFVKLANDFFLALTTYPDVLNPANAGSSQAARAASASAKAAVQTAGASASWISGQNYTKNSLAISTIDYQTYRRKNNGSGTVDPKNDKTNWASINEIENGLIASAFMPGV